MRRAPVLPPALSQRLWPLVAVVAAVVAGLAARYGLRGWAAKYLGVALWSTCLYAVIVFVRPSVRLSRALGLTVAISWAVELAQITPGPAYLSAQHLLLRLIFGTTFSVADLPAYLAGALFGAALHRLATR